MIPRREQQQRVAEIYFYVKYWESYSGLCSDEMVRGYFLVTILSKAT